VLAGFEASPTDPSLSLYICQVRQTGGYFVHDQTDLIGNYPSLNELVTGLEWYLIDEAVARATTPIVHAAALTSDTHTLLLPGKSGAGN